MRSRKPLPEQPIKQKPTYEPKPDKSEASAPVSEPPKKARAERPHIVTIIIGLLSPLLAIVAVWTSREAMVVSQRAYVSVSFLTGTVGTGTQNGSDVSPSVSIQAQFAVHNLGNTPAYNIKTKSKEAAGFGILALEPQEIDIPSKAQQRQFGWVVSTFRSWDDVYRQFNCLECYEMIYIVVEYRDVFGTQQTETVPIPIYNHQLDASTRTTLVQKAKQLAGR